MLERRKRTLCVGIGSLIVLAALASALHAYSPLFQAGQQNPDVPTLHPAVQGLYESCPPIEGSTCLDRLKRMAESGFRLVVNYDQLWGTAEQEIAYAETAHALGMKVIWGMSDPALWNGSSLLRYYPDLSATCRCSGNTAFIQYVVNLVKGLPATWGYYIGNEVKVGDHALFKPYADLIKQTDPSHPRLFVSGEDSTTLGSNLAPFTDTADVLGSDVYPVGTPEPIAAVGSVARAVQSIADRSGKPSVLVLQAFNLAQYQQTTWSCVIPLNCPRFPSEDEMRRMRDLTLQNAHPAFILWYSFFDISKSDNPSAHLDDLVAAASSPPTAVANLRAKVPAVSLPRP